MPILSNFPTGGGSSGGTGLTLGSVSEISYIVGSGCVHIQWNDPEDLVLAEVALATWSGTLLVRKAGSMPVSRRDGTTILDSKEKNAYSDKYFCDAGLANGVTYYYKLFPYTTTNTYTESEDCGFEVTPISIPIGNVSDISTAVAGDGKLSLQWTDPDAAVYSGDIQISRWANTTVVIKEDSYAESPDDNDVVYTKVCTTRNEFSSSPLVASGLSNGVTYYISLFPTTADGTVTVDEVNRITGEANLMIGSVTVNPDSITMGKDSLTETFTVTRHGDGEITAVSSDTSIVTVSLTGDVVTVQCVTQKSTEATITVHVAQGTDCLTPASVTVPVKVQFLTIYGVEWDGTSTTVWSRTDASADFTDPVPAVSNGDGSSPFDDIYPWNGMVRTTDSEAGELVAIPKFWYKWGQSGTKLTLQIADAETDGFYCSPGHSDRGDGSGERDMIYVGRYHCSSTYKSTTGGIPIFSITRSTARSKIAALGDTIWQWDYAINWTIKLLYLVEFADWDSQTKIGYGCTASGSSTTNGQTDGMLYHTGTTASSRTSYGYTQYRNIEGLWDNRFDWLDGCYYSSAGLNIVMNPSKFSDTTNGISVGVLSIGYPTTFTLSTVSGLEWVIRPTTSSLSTSTCLPDSWGYSTSNPCLYAGGSYAQDLRYGLFHVGCSSTTSKNSSYGCRLQKLP